MVHFNSEYELIGRMTQIAAADEQMRIKKAAERLSKKRVVEQEA